LSGGGARGVAHVGVLRTLEEMRIPVDAIAGTSMGAVVGGLYASGLSAAEIDRVLSSVNWQDAFKDRPPRADLGFRRKQDDRNFLVRYALGVQDGEFLLPRGFVQGQKLSQILRSATLPVADVHDFDQLPIPFRALATDLENGESVVMNSGDLVTAMRASMSAPGVFNPVERDGRLLVDGGLMNNLPIDIAQSMGVDVLIVVDVSFPLYARDGLRSPLEVTNQAFAIMIRNRTQAQRQKLGGRDVLIEPALGRMTASDFSRVGQSLRAGQAAAEQARPRLMPLALDAAAYQQYLADRKSRTEVLPVVSFVRVDPDSVKYQSLVDGAMQDVVGKPLDNAVVRKKLVGLYARDSFESIDYTVVEQPAADGSSVSGLEFSLRPKLIGPNSLRVGLNIEDDFEGNSRYNAALRAVVTELNDRGGEWLTDLQIGDNPKLFSEIYQPWSVQSRFFVAPRVELERRTLFLLGDDERRLAKYQVQTVEAGLDVGREIATLGEFRFGLRRGTGRTKVLTGADTLPTDAFDRGGFLSRFSYDKLDSVFFPRKGQQLEIEWRAERTALGAQENFDTVSFNWLFARSLDRNTFIFDLDFGTTFNSPTTPPASALPGGSLSSVGLPNFFTLGGFLNLSGLAPDSLTGPNFAVGRLIYYRKIGRGGTGILDFPTYAGISLEAGNTWQDRRDASFGGLKKDMSLFVGVDTLLGPVFLGTGFDSSGSNAFYLFLGRTF
jgi:NTE family protein